MNDGLHFLDIIFFAVVAAFLILRLRSVLGRRTGTEKPPRQWNSRGEPPSPSKAPAEDKLPDNVIDLARVRKPEPAPTGPLGAGIAAIRAVDPMFSVESFVAGARMAFEIVVDAYAAGNKKALRPLLADAVYAPFAQAIDARERAGESLVAELMGIRSAEVVSLGMEGDFATVTVRFVSEQVHVVKDAEGRIIEGDPSRMVDIVDEWTFRRDVTSRDPNWQLAATRTPQDEPGN